MMQVGKVLLWCFQNLSHPNEFDYTDEFIEMNGAEVCKPHYLFLMAQEDVTAIKLVFDFL